MHGAPAGRGARALSRGLGRVSLSAVLGRRARRRGGVAGAAFAAPRGASGDRRRGSRLPPESAARPAAPPAAAIEEDGCTVSVDCAGELLYRAATARRCSARRCARRWRRACCCWRVRRRCAAVGPHVWLRHAAHRGRADGAPPRAGQGRRFGFQDFPRLPPRCGVPARARHPANTRRGAHPRVGFERGRWGWQAQRAAGRGAGATHAGAAGCGEAPAAAGLPPGLVVREPPYGKRVGELSELGGLYRALGQALKARFPGWRAALLLARDEKLEAALGLAPEASYALDNGGIPCRLLPVFHPPRAGLKHPRFSRRSPAGVRPRSTFSLRWLNATSGAGLENCTRESARGRCVRLMRGFHASAERRPLTHKLRGS